MKLLPANIIHAIIVWQSFLFAVVLFTPRFSKRRSNKYLALILMTLGVHFIYNLLYTNNYYLDILPSFSCSYGYLYGPLLYLYVKFHLIENTKFKTIYWLHFLPFVFIVISTLLGFHICNLVGWWLLPVMLLYCMYSYREIYVYRKTLLQVSSRNQDSEIRLLTIMLAIMIFIVILNMVQTQLSSFEFLGFNIDMEIVVQICVLVLVNVIIYQSFKRPESFQQIKISDVELNRFSKNKKESVEDDTQMLEDLADRLELFMSQKEPYLNPDLTIASIASELDVQVKTLSRAINQIFDSNFSDYINTYRVNAAKAELEKQQETLLSIKEIMYDVGFNSRSVFNTVFKKKTGLTPSEFVKKNIQMRSDS